MENALIIRANSFGKLQEICTVICGNAIFTIFLGSSTDLERLCSRLFSHLVKFFSFTFMHKFSTQVVDVKIIR